MTAIKTAQIIKSQLPVIPTIKGRIACELMVDLMTTPKVFQKIQKLSKRQVCCLLTLNKEAGVISAVVPWWEGNAESTHNIGLKDRTKDEITFFFRNYKNTMIKEFIGALQCFSLFFGG